MNNSANPNRHIVLVVDDDQAVRLMLRYTLEKEGCQVIEAEDGEQSLFMYKRFFPDLIIMDAIMPVMDGFIACEKIQELPGGRTTPILMVTGLEDEKSIDRSFGVGAVDFITKPIKWAVLRHRVRRLLQARQTEVMLNRSEAGAKTVINQSTDGIITVDEEGQITSFNPAAESIFGYRSNEVLGKSIRLMMPDAYRENEEYILKDLLLEHGRPRKVKREIIGLRKDGTLVPVEILISGFFKGEQRLFTVQDISERKHAENRLRLAAIVFENIAEGMMVISADGHIQSVNPAFTKITGYRDDALLGSRIFDHFKHQGDQLFPDIMRWLREEGCYWQGEISSQRKNGDRYFGELKISKVLDDQNKVLQYVAVLNDITEKVKQREERIRLQEQAEKARKLSSLSAMSAGIVHEINQPLNSIKLLTEGVLYRHNRGMPMEINNIMENLKRISTHLDRVDEIIRYMRNFASIGSIKERTPSSVDEIISRAIFMVEDRLLNNGIKIKKEFGENLPKVLINANRLEEVIINLLNNSIQAFEKGNSSDRWIICSISAGEKRISIEISDNATGISDEIIEQMFEPFFTTKPSKGMGLGLFIVQAIITSFGGETRVYNNDCGGATFKIELPAVEVAVI